MATKGLRKVNINDDDDDDNDSKRWALDFRGASVPAAPKDPAAIAFALADRLRRIDAARDGDPWKDDVRSISCNVRSLTESVDVPEGATHKIVGGLFVDSYVRDPEVTEDGQAFYVVFVNGPLKDRFTRVEFSEFVKVDGRPDDSLRQLMAVAPRGSKPRTGMGANNLRKK
jgi:hypothetical protein